MLSKILGTYLLILSSRVLNKKINSELNKKEIFIHMTSAALIDIGLIVVGLKLLGVI